MKANNTIEDKIYDEMIMWMKAKNNNNEFENLHLTRRMMKSILSDTFGSYILQHQQLIHNYWRQIKQQIHSEIVQQEKLNNMMTNLNLNETDPVDHISFNSLKLSFN